MAQETFLTNKFGENIIIEGEKDIIDRYTEIKAINGTDITAGDFVTVEGETDPDVDLVGSAEAPLGIVLGYANEAEKKAAYSLGVTIADNKLIKILRRTGQRVKVQAVLNRGDTDSAALVVGDPLYISQVDAGKLTELIGATVANVLNAKTFVGYIDEPVAVAKTNDVIVTLWM